MSDKKIISLEEIKIACRGCNLATLCLPRDLSPEDIDKMDKIVTRNRPFHRGDHLFKEGDTFRSLFVIKTGSVMTYTPYEDGSDKVLGFHFSLELIGLDAITDERHHCSAKVLETTAACELPFERFEELSTTIPSLQHQMYSLLSKEIAHNAEMLTHLGKKSAEVRLAVFLTELSTRFKQRGFSATDLNLSMSRHEIGSFLGLAVETVSRLFTRFQDEGLLRVERKHVEILNPAGLQAIIHQDGQTNLNRRKFS